MTNLLTVLPDFDIQPFTHILPSLEKALVSAADLLTLDALDVAKRAQVPPGEVRKLNVSIRLSCRIHTHDVNCLCATWGALTDVDYAGGSASWLTWR